MRTRAEIIELLTNPGVIAIVRAPSADKFLPIGEALLAGGVIAVELTMTTPGALQAIEEGVRQLGERAVVGVGTVLDLATCRAAIAAGAEFVVTPICRTELVKAAHAADRPVMLGAYTPTEAQAAHEAGADFVKLFPADGLGPAYIKALRAPLPHLRIVPTGGVDANTAGAFIKAGCAALGVGSALVSAQILRDNNWPELTRLARELVNAVRAAKAG